MIFISLLLINIFKKNLIMKKILFTLIVLLTITISGFAQSALTVQGGYSWSNGLIGAEFQMGRLAVSAGYFPTKMPGSGESLSSFSGNFLLYGGDWDESSYYASIGVASAGYRSQNSYNGGAWTDDVVSPMTIVMVGYKGAIGNLNSKIGFGYGWCDYGNSWTWELTLGWAIPMN